MLRFFERRLEATGPPPDMPPPVLDSPNALLRFYWHFVRQIPGPVLALFTTGFFVAITDAAIPVCIGRIVSLVSSQEPETIWAEAGPQLLLMAALFLIARPAAHFAQAVALHVLFVDLFHVDAKERAAVNKQRKLAAHERRFGFLGRDQHVRFLWLGLTLGVRNATGDQTTTEN